MERPTARHRRLDDGVRGVADSHRRAALSDCTPGRRHRQNVRGSSPQAQRYYQIVEKFSV